VVKQNKKRLGADHPHTLKSMANLALIFYSTDRRARNSWGRAAMAWKAQHDAVMLLEHVVKVQQTTLAENHPSRLASQHALARAYKANGQVKEAVKLLKHAVSMKSHIVALSHPTKQASEVLLSQIRPSRHE
jgi:hypothetical protein